MSFSQRSLAIALLGSIANGRSFAPCVKSGPLLCKSKRFLPLPMHRVQAHLLANAPHTIANAVPICPMQLLCSSYPFVSMRFLRSTNLLIAIPLPRKSIPARAVPWLCRSDRIRAFPLRINSFRLAANPLLFVTCRIKAILLQYHAPLR